jgi:hypothetical protein
VEGAGSSLNAALLCASCLRDSAEGFRLDESKTPKPPMTADEGGAVSRRGLSGGEAVLRRS